MDADCKIVSDMLMLDRTKAIQFALDRGAIISKIIQIEKECEIEFECAHARSKNGNDENGCSHENKLTSECDKIAK